MREIDSNLLRYPNPERLFPGSHTAQVCQCEFLWLPGFGLPFSPPHCLPTPAPPPYIKLILAPGLLHSASSPVISMSLSQIIQASAQVPRFQRGLPWAPYVNSTHTCFHSLTLLVFLLKLNHSLTLYHVYYLSPPTSLLF